MRKLVSIVLCGVLSASLLAGCGAKTEQKPAEEAKTEAPAEEAKEEAPAAEAPAAEAPAAEAPAEEAKTEAPAEPAAEGVTELTLWHSNSGTNGDVMQEIVDAFNASQTKYHLTAEYQGEYADAATKYKATNAGDLPDLFMSQCEQSTFMIANGHILPIQQFIDKEGYDTSDLMRPTIASYTVNNTLYALPMGTSLVGTVYNATYFEEAGIDPALLNTWDGMFEAAQKLVESGVCQYGGALNPVGLGLEFIGSAEGYDIVNNGNGRDGLADKTVLGENGCGEFVFGLYKRAAESPYFTTAYTVDSDYRSLLISGDLGFFWRSISYIGAVNKGFDGKYKVGFANTPRSENSTGGPIPGGCCCWLVDTGDENRENGAWEFMKWLLTEDMQLKWASTGYIPLTYTAFNSAEYGEYMDNICPSMRQVVEEYDKEGALQPLLGICTEWRELMTTEIFNLYNNPDYTPKEATENFCKAADQALEMYKMTNE